MLTLMKSKKAVLLGSISNKIHGLLGNKESNEEQLQEQNLRHSLFEKELELVAETQCESMSIVEMVRKEREREEGEDFRLEDEIDLVAGLFIIRFYKQMRMQKLLSFKRSAPSQVFGFDPTIQGHQSAMPRAVQETYSSTGGISGIPLSGNSKPSMHEFKSSSMPINALQPEQLAQLVLSLIGQQGQVGNIANAPLGENIWYKNRMDHSDTMRQQQGYSLQNNQAIPELSTSQFSQLQQTSNSAAAVSQATQRNQQLQGTDITEEGDGDPQKCLQATLQLATALFQQIQQGKGI
ncbi:hypothetical protein V6N11_072104 [Hibiscus sabdariffa]|uniref:Uncharacterized protein n=1 Tax=Hibiscus sabdariffa TaxID=183260 RepID=A0ABR2U2R7_9ROSI